MLYWTDWSLISPGIYRSPVINPARETLVSGSLTWPNALAIDFTGNQSYHNTGILLASSHAGTVVPECFKDDNASQWKSGKFDPRSLKNPRTDRHLNLHG